MRILALDVGTKYIGIAISDERVVIAQPYGSYTRQTLKKDLLYFDQLVKSVDIDKILIGYPLYLDGSDSQMTLFVKKFYYKLRDRWEGIKVILWDESLTTEESEEIIFAIKNNRRNFKEQKDIISACLILKSYIDSNGDI